LPYSGDRSSKERDREVRKCWSKFVRKSLSKGYCLVERERGSKSGIMLSKISENKSKPVRGGGSGRYQGMAGAIEEEKRE